MFRFQSKNLRFTSAFSTSQQFDQSKIKKIQNCPIRFEQMVEFLDKLVFMNMLHYEEAIFSGKVTRSVVQELISLYAQCVEFYDSIHDPIEFYFLEKMQILLSRESTLKEIAIHQKDTPDKYISQNPQRAKNKQNVSFLEEGAINEVELSNKELKQKQYMRAKMKLKQLDISDEPQNEEKAKSQEKELVHEGEEQKQKIHQNQHESHHVDMKMKYRQTPKNAKYSMSKKKIERSKRVGMYLQLQKEQEIVKADTFIQNSEVSNAAQVDTVNQNLNLQMQDFEKRLLKRKQTKEGFAFSPMIERSQSSIGLQGGASSQFSEAEYSSNSDIKTSEFNNHESNSSNKRKQSLELRNDVQHFRTPSKEEHLQSEKQVNNENLDDWQDVIGELQDNDGSPSKVQKFFPKVEN